MVPLGGIKVGEIQNPALSPDGTEVAFSAFVEYNTDIYIVGIDGSNSRA